MPRSIKCSVYDCWRKSTDPEKLTFHRFPCDVDLCRKWLQMAGVKELTWLPETFLTRARHVCSTHFPPSSYRHGTNFLKLGSVPSVFERPVMPLTEEDVMVYPLNGRKRKKKDKDTASSLTDLDKDKVGNEAEVSSVSPKATRTSEIICNSPTFMEYLNTGAGDSGGEEFAEVLEPATIAEEETPPALQVDVTEGKPDDPINPERIVLPDSLHYSFTITENLDIRLDVTKKPEPPQDLEFWKSCAERLGKENEALASKVEAMQRVIDNLQKEVESTRSLNSVNLGMATNQCYFIDLTSAIAPISL